MAYEGDDEKLKNITINIPFMFNQAISDLIEAGKVKSRCDFMRKAIKSFLAEFLPFLENINKRPFKP